MLENSFIRWTAILASLLLTTLFSRQANAYHTNQPIAEGRLVEVVQDLKRVDLLVKIGLLRHEVLQAKYLPGAVKGAHSVDPLDVKRTGEYADLIQSGILKLEHDLKNEKDPVRVAAIEKEFNKLNEVSQADSYRLALLRLNATYRRIHPHEDLEQKAYEAKKNFDDEKERLIERVCEVFNGIISRIKNVNGRALGVSDAETVNGLRGLGNDIESIYSDYRDDIEKARRVDDLTKIETRLDRWNESAQSLQKSSIQPTE